MNNPHQKKIALSLSAFVLPGLGQLHLKKKIKGWSMIILCFLDIIFIFGKFTMALLVVSEKFFPQKRNVLGNIGKELWMATQMQKEWLLGGFFFLILIWLWSLYDLWKAPVNSEG